ncbi:MAG: hypothetical protein OXB93_00410 [Cytophagales bacterium]|nr:hypothetical protein [Cytophagales bacterium]
MNSCSSVSDPDPPIDKTLSPIRQEEIRQERDRKALRIRLRESYSYHCYEDNPRLVKNPILVEYFDKEGRLIMASSYEKDKEEKREYIYDSLGNKVKLKIYRGEQEELREVWQYDKRGFLITKLSRLRGTEIWKKDRVEAVKDEQGRVLSAHTYNYKNGKVRDEYFSYWHDSWIRSKEEIKEYGYEDGKLKGVKLAWNDEKGNPIRNVISYPQAVPMEINYVNSYDPEHEEHLVHTAYYQDSVLYAVDEYKYEGDLVREHVYLRIHEGDTIYRNTESYDEKGRLLREYQQSSRRRENPYAYLKYDEKGILLTKEEFAPDKIPNYTCTFYRYAFY